MVPEGIDDGEGDLLAAVREQIGPRIPVGVTLDFHANVTAAMVRHATLLHGYKTYPHVDMAERGREAAERLADVAAGKIRPTTAFRQPRLLPPIASQRTAEGPMRRLYDLADEMERDPRVVSVSVFAGFPLADIHDAGLSIYVATNGDPALAESLADRLEAVAWIARCLSARRWRTRSDETSVRSSSPTSPTTRVVARPATARRSCASCSGSRRLA